MSAIVDLIAAARDAATDLRSGKPGAPHSLDRLADAAEKELESQNAYIEHMQESIVDLQLEPRTDLEALRRALHDYLSGPMLGWPGGDSSPFVKAGEHLRALLAQLEGAKRAEVEAWLKKGDPVGGMLIGEGAKGQPHDWFPDDGVDYCQRCGWARCAVEDKPCAPKPEAQTCPECRGHGERLSARGSLVDGPLCTTCNGTGTVGGGK